jgi:CRP-like cAMP-binding protein
MASGVRAGAVAGAALGARTGSGLDREWVAVLAQVPLFAGLSKRHLRHVVALARSRRFERGSQIIRKGQAGGAFYVILDGRARVTVPGRRAVVLHAGESFGELALLDGAPRSADVSAVDDVLVLEIGTASFGKLLRKEPQIPLALLRTLAGRLRSAEGGS